MEKLMAAAGFRCRHAKAGCSQAITTAFALHEETSWRPKGKRGVSMALDVRIRICCSDLFGFVQEALRSARIE